MKNIRLFLIFIFIGANAMRAQVGIGTTNPEAVLDIRSTSQALPSYTDGILIPKIDEFPVTAPTAAQDGMLVYATGLGSVSKGFYYWDSSILNWVALTGGSQDHDFYEEGTTTSPDNISDDQFTLGNLAIGKNTADWRLDVEEPNGGRGMSILMNGTVNANTYGLFSELTNTGGGIHYGTYASLTGTSAQYKYGNYNELSGSAPATENYGVYNDFSTIGSPLSVGTSNVFSSGDYVLRKGVFNDLRGGEALTQYGVHNLFASTVTNSDDIGVFNELNGSIPTNMYGTYQLIANTGGGIHYGTYASLTGTGAQYKYGSYNELSGSAPATESYGVYNDFSTIGSSPLSVGTSNVFFSGDYIMRKGVFNDLRGGEALTQYGVHNLFASPIGTADDIGVFNELNGSSPTNMYGTRQVITNTGGGIHYGTYAYLTGTNAQYKYGSYNELSGSAPATQSYGVYNDFSTIGSPLSVGTSNVFSSGDYILRKGVFNDLRGGEAMTQYGVHNLFASTVSNADDIAVYNELNGTAGGDMYGINQEIGNTGSGTHYGVFNTLTGSGTGDKYGSYSFINPAAGGTHYGIYTSVLKAGSYAGYFLGNVSIGTTTGNSYIFPPSRGTANQIMQIDGAGNVSWTDGSSIAHRIDDLLDGKSDPAGTSVFLGVNAGTGDNLTNNYNIGIGFNALNTNINSNYNVAIGSNSLRNSNGGIGNVATGSNSLVTNTTGSYNTGIAIDALRSNTTGSYNIGVGSAALYDNTIGADNIAVGTAAAGDNTTGDNNVAVGFHALRTNSIGNNNVALGYQAGYNLAGNNNVVLGFQAGYNETGSNRLYIDNSNTVAPLVYGEFDNNLLRINGRTEITSNIDANGVAGTGSLEIAGTLRIDGNEIITNTNSPLFIQADNNGDVRVDGTTLAVDASTNRVGIGTVTPAFQLQLTTNSAAKPTSNVWTIFSDSRLKTNVRPFTDGLAMLKQINPVWFTYNGKACMPKETGVGTLAQDFQKIAPYMVKPWNFIDEEKGISETYLGIDYGPLSFVMVNAIQEQQSIIEGQNQKIETLEQKLVQQQKEIDEIKAFLKKQ